MYPALYLEDIRGYLAGCYSSKELVRVSAGTVGYRHTSYSTDSNGRRRNRTYYNYYKVCRSALRSLEGGVCGGSHADVGGAFGQAFVSSLGFAIPHFQNDVVEFTQTRSRLLEPNCMHLLRPYYVNFAQVKGSVAPRNMDGLEDGRLQV